MQQGNLTTLLSKLLSSVGDTTATGESILQGLRADIAPLVSAEITPAAAAPQPATPATPAVAAPVAPAAPAKPAPAVTLTPLHITAAIDPRLVTLKNAFDTPLAARIVQQVPDVLSALQSPALSPVPTPTAQANTVQNAVMPLKGISVLQSINLQTISATLGKWYHNFFTQEFISVYLSTDTTHPVLLLPVSVPSLTIPILNTDLAITQGSVWILSSMFDSSAPAGAYTGLTVSGGSLSFDKHLSVVNKAINMPAGATCTVHLNLQQPVDTSTPPDNTGIDAKNAGVQLPTQFSFSFSTPALKINSIADGSWKLYGSANTFQYDPSQTALYTAVLNSIVIPFKVTAPTFSVSACNSPFFTIQGSSPISEGCWELPVATIDITNPGVATGAGALGVVCSKGLQAQWAGLSGGWIDLRFPFISAAPGLIGIIDFLAGNVYANQNFNLWSNETTGLFSTLRTNYSAQFPLYYLCVQAGSEVLSTVASFVANVDRPVRVDDSPVEVKGSDALLFFSCTSTSKVFVMYDFNLLQENYGTPGVPVTDVPPEALALTNALMTTTPVTGAMVFGTLDTPNNFKHAYMFLTFGMFYLIPALPDPYAATFSKLTRRRMPDTRFTGVGIARSYPLSAVEDLLLGLVRWPVVTNPPTQPPAQPPRVAFAVVPISNPDAGVTPVAAMSAPASWCVTLHEDR